MLKKYLIIGGYLLTTYILTSCSSEKYEISVSEKIIVKKDSFKIFYLILKNNNYKTLKINKVQPSCQCVIIDKIKSIERFGEDSIKVKINGIEKGNFNEQIIFSLESDYKLYNLNYEVIE